MLLMLCASGWLDEAINSRKSSAGGYQQINLQQQYEKDGERTSQPSRNVRSKISEINRYSQIDWDRYLNPQRSDYIPEGHVVFIWDVDGTILFDKDRLGQGWNQGIRNTDSPEYRNKWLEEITTWVWDDTIVETFNALRDHGHLVFFLTHIYSGKTSNCQNSLQLNRFKELEKHGFKLNDIHDNFEQLPSNEPNRKPLCFNSICVTGKGKYSKGQVFEYSLYPLIEECLEEKYPEIEKDTESDHYKPLIVYFDDLRNEVEILEETCRKLELPFEGYKMPGQPTPWQDIVAGAEKIGDRIFDRLEGAENAVTPELKEFGDETAAAFRDLAKGIGKVFKGIF